MAFVDLQPIIDEAVHQVRRGDREAYRAIVEACESRLRVLVAPVLPDPATVEDVVQQTFVTAYRKLDQYQTGTGFMAWIATIARYEALNERRRWITERSFRRRYGDEVRIEQFLEDDLVEASAEWDEGMVERLHHCIGGLQERTAAVVKAHYFQLQDNHDIAAAHGHDAAWVRLVLHRARLAIASCLKAQRGAHA
ncbi:MAG: sigma-70 family RNA polymerase sigma factor [Planctomycetes bacterium]|nr:sigma-70 family RNA polymerase sigma factor [Planctomycetota bacterium]